ncbi:MAG: LamG domain-containing protein [Candidatus Cyclobacteriaceae bacterium M3_2C_046]
MLIYSTGCEDGYIDEISPADPGPDEAAPEVNINYPTQETLIRVREEVTSVEIDFEVVDDIEIEKIQVILDGNEIASYNDFKDYRRVLEEFQYEELTTGTHTLLVTAIDVSGKASGDTVTFEKVAPYVPEYEGEIFYMPFNGDYMELISIEPATVVGDPGFAEGVDALSYDGAVASYLTFPADTLKKTDEFSASFWYNVNAETDRAGILVVGPVDEANPDAMNDRTSGFRLFREDAGGMQRLKLNLGTGEAEAWFDGGPAADLDPAMDQWVHVAFTISGNQATVFLNGEIVSQGEFPGIDWTNTDILSIMSGEPRFAGWNHLSDTSLMDELRFFNKTLSQEEIQAIIEAERP